MSELRYTKEHEWLNISGGVATIGITDFAQEQLGDIVFVELPEIGQELAKRDHAVTIESVKAAGELNAPLAGAVTEVNEVLREAPETVNRDPNQEGWFYRIKLNGDADPGGFMDQLAHEAYLETC